MNEDNKEIEKQKIELDSIDDFDQPATTSVGMTILLIFLGVLIVGSIFMRMLI
jgi:hypothetical protein